MTAPGTRLLVAVSADTVIDTEALAASEPVAAMGAGDRTYWVTGVAANAVNGNAAVISRPARPQPIVLALRPIAAVMTQSPRSIGHGCGRVLWSELGQIPMLHRGVATLKRL